MTQDVPETEWAYRRTNDEAVGSLSLTEGKPFLLLQTKHSDGQRENQGFP